jgi:hypothetical protein
MGCLIVVFESTERLTLKHTLRKMTAFQHIGNKIGRTMPNIYNVDIHTINSETPIPPSNFNILDYAISNNTLKILIECRDNEDPHIKIFWNTLKDKIYLVGGKTLEHKAFSKDLYTKMIYYNVTKVWLTVNMSCFKKNEYYSFLKRIPAEYHNIIKSPPFDPIKIKDEYEEVLLCFYFK